MRHLMVSARRLSVLDRRRLLAAAALAACPAVAISLVAPAAYGQRVFGLDTSSAANTDVTQTQWNNAFNNGDGVSISSFKFAIVRSSRGGTVDQAVDDTIFYNNMLRGTNAGLLMGSYHYARPDAMAHTAADDAQHYLNRAGMYMKPGYLLPVFDLVAGNTSYTTQGLTDWALQFCNTILAAKGITPIVYVNSSYANDEVNSQLAWFDSNTPKTSPRTYQWLARPSNYSDLISGNPAPALPTYPDPYGVWDPNFTTRSGSPDPVVKPWVFWQNGSTHLDPNNPTTSTRFLIDYDAVNGNMEFLKDFLVPALWTNPGSGDWSTQGNWNSDNPTYNGTAASGPAPRLPNALDWVKFQNAGGGTITLSSGARSVRKFYTQQPFNMTGGSLTVGYVPGSGGKWDLPSEFAAAVTLASPAAYSAHTTQVDGGGGVFNINGGTVTFSAINLASHSSNPGKIVMGGDATFTVYGGAGTAVIQSTGALAQAGFVDLGSANRTLTINNGSAAVDVMITAGIIGTGGLTKAGPGTLQLTGANSYTGATTVNAGTLTATGASALGASTGALTVANPNTGAGTNVVLNLSATATTTKGSLSGSISPPSSGTNTATINNGGQLFTINQTNVGTFPGVIAGTGGFALGSLSTNVLTLAGANTYAGGTTVNAGTLAYGASNVLADGGAVNVAGGTLNVGAFNDTVGAVTLTSGTITGTTGTLTGASYGVQGGTISAKLGGTAALTKTGAGAFVTISAPQSYTGGTNVNAGNLNLGAGGSLADTGAVTVNGGTFNMGTVSDTVGAVTLASGSILGTNATLTAPSFAVQSGSISANLAGTGAAAMTKSTAGTVTLSGANSYPGGTAVNGGTLIAAHSSAFGTDGLTVAAGATAQMQASLSTAMALSSVATTGSGQFDLTNNSLVVKNSTLSAVQAQVAKGFNAGTWTGTGGINSSSAAGDATHLTTIGYASNGTLNLTNFKGVTGLDSNDVLVKYTYYGDADLSGSVTLDDFTLFLHGYQGGGTTWFVGDFNYNGVVTLDDFTQFLYGYQNQGAPLSALEQAVNSSDASPAQIAAMIAAVQAVPEPDCVAVMAVAYTGFMLSRRRRAGRGLGY
jgi:autotransporter-associated beta strand protein